MFNSLDECRFFYWTNNCKKILYIPNAINCFFFSLIVCKLVI